MSYDYNLNKAALRPVLGYPSWLSCDSEVPAEEPGFKKNFEAMCKCYNIDPTNLMAFATAWIDTFNPKKRDSKEISVWDCCWHYDYYRTNYYHMLKGSIVGYKLALETKRASPPYEWLNSIDYSTPLSSDSFKEFLSLETRKEVERTGEDYFDVQKRLQDVIAKAIVEHSCCSHKGFYVSCGLRRYTLIEAYINDPKHANAKIMQTLLKIKEDDHKAVINNELFHGLF